MSEHLVKKQNENSFMTFFHVMQVYLHCCVIYTETVLYVVLLFFITLLFYY